MTDHQQVVKKYLQRLLQFKANKELHNAYLNEEKRDQLLHDLFDSLGFEPELWEIKNRNAKQHFLIAERFEDDSDLENIHPRTYCNKICEHLNKAIALDPFNEIYLKKYVLDLKEICPENEDYKRRLLCIYDPNSSEYQNSLIDLDLPASINEYDYLSDQVLHPFVDELVFLKEHPEIQARNPEKMDHELAKMAEEGGIEKNIIEDAKKHLETHLKTASKVFDYWWKNWDEALKSHLSLQKALDISPYNKEALEIAISYHGHFFWRLILGYTKAKKSQKGKKKFFKTLFGKEKLSKEEIEKEIFKSLETASEYQKRYAQIMMHETKDEEEDEWMSSFHTMRFSFALKDLFGSLMKQGDTKVEHLRALVQKEKEVVPVFLAHQKMINSNKKLMWIIGPIILALVSLLAYVVFPLFLGVLFPIFIGIMGTAGILELRKKYWKNRELKIQQS